MSSSVEGVVKVSKQVYELTPADLANTPVWEFALDEEGEEGQDEATVRPVESALPLNTGDGMFIVRAHFRLSDGTNLQGYLTPGVQGDSLLSTVQPIIVTTVGQVMFWLGAFPRQNSVEAAYRLLGKPAQDVFPVTYVSDVPLAQGPVRGTLNGFAHYASLTDRTMVEIR